MHYLHPRSRSTSTLFTTTLAVSFIIVGLPHVLPCPVDRRQFADSYETADGKIRKRRQRDETTHLNHNQHEDDAVRNAEIGEDGLPKRECPVPKPSGIVGQILGFRNEERPRPAEIVVNTLETRQTRQSHKGKSNGT